MDVTEVLETFGDRLRLLTAEEFLLMVEQGLFVDEHVELLDGVVVQRMGEGEDHRWVIDELTEILVTQLAGRLKVRVDGPFVASKLSVPEPDFAVVDPATRKGKEHPRRVELVIEVADSSRGQDLGYKAQLYARAGVGEYWVVDVPNREVVVHRDPRPDGYATLECHGTSAVLDACGATVEVGRLFAPD
jgi:Uma2 family endonuclease